MTDPKRTYCPPLVAKALPDGHPQKREPMRPRGAGSEVRRAVRFVDHDGAAYDFDLPPLTGEQAERILAALANDDTDLWTRLKCRVSDFHARVRALPLPNALGLVAILVAGACVLVVGLAYGWGAAWRLAW